METKIGIIQRLEKLIVWGVYAVPFLLPFQTRLLFSQQSLGGAIWEYGSFSLYALEVYLLILVVLTGIVHLFDFKEEIHFLNQQSYVLKIIIALIAVMGIVSVFVAHDVSLALWAAFRLLLGIGFAFVLIHTQFSLHRFAQIFSLSAVIQALLGMWQVFVQYIPASTLLGMSLKTPALQGVSVVETVGGRLLRAHGMFGHPNIYAAFILLGMVCSLVLLFTHRSAREKIAVYLALVVQTTGLFFSFSRMAGMALGVVLVITGLYFFINSNRGLLRLLRNALGIVVGVSLLWGLLYADVASHFYNASAGIASASVTERVSMIETARELIQLHWSRGVGIGNYTHALAEYSEGLDGFQAQPVHNVYLLVLVELGIGGAFIFVLLFYEILKHVVRMRITYSAGLLEVMEEYEKRDMYEEEYAFTTHWYVVLSAVLVAFLCWMLFDHFFWTISSGIIMLWMIVGLWIRQFVRAKK